MSRYKRPNPDTWHVRAVLWEQAYDGGELRIELWESVDDCREWVLVADSANGTQKTEHAPLTDAMASRLIGVMESD